MGSITRCPLAIRASVHIVSVQFRPALCQCASPKAPVRRRPTRPTDVLPPNPDRT